MSDLVLIPKRVNQNDEQAPCWWTMGKIVYVRCPECGAQARLAHDVAEDGTVNPSIWHQCGEATGKPDWHIWGKLDGWQP